MKRDYHFTTFGALCTFLRERGIEPDQDKRRALAKELWASGISVSPEGKTIPLDAVPAGKPDYQGARSALGLSHRGMMALLGISDRQQSRRYEDGERALSGPAQAVIAYALREIGADPMTYGFALPDLRALRRDWPPRAGRRATPAL